MEFDNSDVAEVIDECLRVMEIEALGSLVVEKLEGMVMQKSIICTKQQYSALSVIQYCVENNLPVYASMQELIDD